MGKEEFASVTAAAQALGVSADTIRRWSKLGLIKSTRDKNQKRMFNLAELHRLRRKLNGEGDSTDYQILRADETFDDATCIDLFAGAGGTALGFSNAGINHVLLNEFDKNAAQALKDNSDAHGLNWVIDDRDVHDVEFSPYQAEIMQAGFPCQAFSYAGKSKGFEDTRGTLFFEFARAIHVVQPKIAIGENVRGLERHDGGRTLKTMLAALDDLGYRVNYKILRAQYLDVPQKRERLIIFAVRKDLDCPILFPKERDYFISLKQALEGCPDSEGQEYPEKKRKVMERVPEGGCWRDLPDDVAREYMGAAIIFPEEEPVWRDVCRGISRV